jgi:general secretion pathway protein N
MARLKITKTGRRLIYLGIISYLVFLLYALPASFLTRYILPSIPSARAVSLQGVHGSVWKGQASNARISNFSLGKLQWDLRAWGLLLGKLRVHLKFNQDGTSGAGLIDIGMGGSLSAQDVNLQFPAESLMPLLYGFPISIAGELRGNFKTIDIEPGEVMQMQGRVVWQGAALRAPQNVDMGDILITLEPFNRGSKILIKDQGHGPIETEINIVTKGTGDYRMNGWLKARDSSQQHITETLRLIGRADNSGKVWVGYNGKLKRWGK